MKKLVALISSVALVLSMAFSGSAATATTTYVDGTGDQAGYGTFTTTITGDVGGQATLLVFTGERASITANSIEYIDQQTSTVDGTTFVNYKLKNKLNPGDKITAYVGGSTAGDAVLATVADYTPVAPTPTPSSEPSSTPGYKVYGTVSNAAELAGGSFANETEKGLANEAWKTYVVLKNTIKDTTTVLPPVEVDPVSKIFEIKNVPNGNYVAVIYRAGFLPRYIKNVNVANADFPLGDKTLLMGDMTTSTNYPVYGSIGTDAIVDSTDRSVLMTNFFKDVKSPGFVYHYDLTGDFIVDSTDISSLMTNFFKDILNYNEGVAWTDFN